MVYGENAIINGGIGLLKIRKIFSIMIALTTLTGGNMMVNAVKETTTTPAVEYAHELDAQAYSGTDLGAVYTKKSTTFKVWAPTASSVAVKLYKTGSSQEEGAQDISTTAMTKGENGVWSAELLGNRKNLYYTYLVTVDGVTRETADIYAKAAGVNGNRSMIVDLDSTDPEGWDKDEHILYDNPTDAVVWEVHIKDFSHSQVSGISVKNKGKYLAFTETGTTLGDEGKYSTCIDYLKKLGVTHVQLLPVYDYATVDESAVDSDEFNWGYDPKNYNVPEGSYSTNPFDGNVRINEFKQMIMALHDAGIGVIMDVVFNHTFTAEGGWFEATVPGYYYRMKPDGSFSDGSGCGNETASDHLMYRKYMKDSILYWTNEYHIDGFRFDLMGIHDVDTMNEIRNALDTQVTNGSKIILYGEPWTGGDLGTNVKTAVKTNVKLLNERVGAFNDEFRDAVKGHVFNALEKGFIQDGGSKGGLQAGIGANTVTSDWFNSPSQTVSYVSAHDNYTLYDKLVLSVKNDMSYDTRDEILVDMNKMAAALVLTSQGVSFMQAGEEFARTKQGDENSYVSPAELNELDWNHVRDYADLVSYYSGLIEIRKHFKPFRDPTKTSAQNMNFVDCEDGVVAYTLENSLTPGTEWKTAALVFNASEAEKTVTLTPPDGGTLPEEWTVIVNKGEAGLSDLGTVKGQTVTLPARSTMMLVDKKSFDSVAAVSDACVVRTEHQDSETGEVLSSSSLRGTSGSAFETKQDASLRLGYDFVSVEGKTEGLFTKEPQKVVYKYKKFEGKLVELTTHYYQEKSEALGGGVTEVASGQTLTLREGDDYFAVIRELDGLTVDLNKFPANAAGKAGKDNITVDFYYIRPEDTDLVIHYYNSEGWKNVGVRVYCDDEDKTAYTSDDGDMMQADSALGNDWYSFTVKNIGSAEDIYAVFTDTKGRTDSHFGEKGVKVRREVWVKDGKLTPTGVVNAVYIEEGGEVLKTKVMTGKSGEEYQTAEETFDGLQTESVTSNTKGTFADSPIYVVYTYSKPEPPAEKDRSMLPVVLIAGGAAALAAAGALFVSARKKKKRIVD